MAKLRTLLTKRFSEKAYPDLSDPKIKEAMAKGRAEFEESYLGKRYTWILGGQTFLPVDSKTYSTRHPGDKTIVVGKFPDSSCFSKSEVMVLLKKVREAGTAFAESVSWQKRIALLCEISKVIEERFWLIVAALQYETGQNAKEAIGETDEAVDFPLADAMYMEEMHRELLIPSSDSAGDFNGKRYVPHGTFLNIDPFNFPCAIPMDAACKALAMGNSIIVKPSDKSSLCGYQAVYESIVMAFERLGISHEGVVNYVPGGPEIVDMLLASPDISGVSFTGSSDALAEIKRKHGEMLRNTYCGKAPLAYGSEETSGVNIVVVWHDTNIRRAAEECVKSFVGRQGQKCSSARIIMVHERVHHAFVGHLQEELRKLWYGDSLRDNNDVGPVITQEAGRRIQEAIRAMVNCGIIGSIFSKNDTGDYCLHDNDQVIAPTVLYASNIVLYDEKFGTEFMNTEIFGPVTSVIAVSDLDDVRHLRELSHFALTSSSFCGDVDTCIALDEILRTGNSYQNRKCTGAFVETECFGGARSRSGTGKKGRASMDNFGSMPITSGFYDPQWSTEERRRFIKGKEKLGFVFSKT